MHAKAGIDLLLSNSWYGLITIHVSLCLQHDPPFHHITLRKNCCGWKSDSGILYLSTPNMLLYPSGNSKGFCGRDPMMLCKKSIPHIDINPSTLSLPLIIGDFGYLANRFLELMNHSLEIKNSVNHRMPLIGIGCKAHTRT